ncbi:alpha-amylase family glycosyl hydrolase [Emticicia sp. BO119]|uniref:alpha-amylase family glycosyl hydrolase n=1 Tax=Emticicia sp. BO119 TaxID=2757768 RepID=UPI0015F0A02F|nr:alpha-amylase family glycosyl hydrolase [Emticicia sp. BO119]MBA4852972.1 alpha amylase C-terminal domain-containing protein [Emticicia sp. BO119]
MKNVENQTEIYINGMGATPHQHGVFFRVWAPHADYVSVIGDFNDWNEGANPLIAGENGCWGVNIENAKEGDQYKFFIKNGELNLYKNDPYARQVTNSVGNSIVYNPKTYDWENVTFQMPSWNEIVIYELHIGTFNRSKPDKVGTFHDAIKKLPYLKSLGINAVEIMPPFEFAGGVSWGYNPAHPYAIETEYGGPRAFKDFIKEAHKLGIAVILDVVYNHFGPSDLDLWQFDGWSENGKGGIYFYNDWRSTTPWGDTRPDYERPEVGRYIKDNAIMWLEDYKVDGLRMDMVPYIRNVHADGNPAHDLQEGLNMIRWINSEIRERFPNALVVAEDMHGHNFITDSVQVGGLGYGSQWDADFVHPLRNVLTQASDEYVDMNLICGALFKKYSDDVMRRVVFTESHDEVANGKARVAEEVEPGNATGWYARKKATLGAVMVLTSPGIPMIFQGQTIQQDSWFQDTEPLDWARLKEVSGISNMYKDMIHLRRNLTGVSAGLMGQNTELLALDNDRKLIAFQRWHQGGSRDTTIVVMNFSHEAILDYPIKFPSEGKWLVRFNGDSQSYESDFTHTECTEVDTTKENEAITGQVSVGPYSALVLSQD